MSDDESEIERHESGDSLETPTSSPSTIADVLAETAVQSTSVETETVDATLVGVPELELEEFVYAHQLDGSHDAGERRQVALFDLKNTGDQPIRWRSARTKFIGDDEYTYRPAHVSLEPASLGPGCHTGQVEIEPGHRARMVTLVERLPPGVEITQVVQTVAWTGSGSSERLVFSLG